MSGVPTAITALYELWSPIRELKVFDGPPTKSTGGDQLIVGYGPEGLPTTAAVATADLGMGDRESVQVASVIRAWDGGGEFGPLRTRVYGHLAECRRRLVSDPTVGRRVARAHYSGHAFQQYRNPEGQQITDLIFQVDVVTFLA